MFQIQNKSYLGSTVDWKTLFNGLIEHGKVPDSSTEIIDQNHAEFQAMYLDLGEIKEKITQSNLDPPLVTVYADVLNVPANLSWLLQSAVLMVVARRIQTSGSNSFNIDYRTNDKAQLVLFMNEVEGSIEVVAAYKQKSDEGKKFMISSAPSKGGIQIAYKDGAPVEVELTRAKGLPMQPTETFQQALMTDFIIASLLYDQQPAIALDMLTWIKEWAGESSDLIGMFLRSSSLVSLLSSQINAKKNGASFVPYLTQDIYTQLANAFVNEAKQYESDYMNLSTQKVLTDNDIKLAKTLLDNKINESQYVQKLMDQTKSNYENAISAAEKADDTFKAAQQKAQMVKIDFEKVGVPEWERAQILKAVISLATAAITFGVGIAAMLVGDEAGGAASAESAVEGAKAVEKAAKTGSEIAKMAKELADVMKKLKKIVEALNKVYEFSKQVIAAAKDIQNAQEYAKKMQGMDISTGGIDITATYEWQVYQLNADAAMKDPVEKGIGYANELKLAIDEVAIYGQALAAAQLAVVKAGQEYAKVLLQKELAEKEQKRLQRYVESLKVGEAPIVAMMQQFYQRYLDAKSSLFSALEGYRASFFYWALETSSIQPKIIDSVNDIDTGLKDLTSITLDKANALRRFSPPPQTMSQKLQEIDASSVLNELKKSGKASWSITLDAKTFSGFGRVRLTRVRTWIEGAKPKNSTGTINITITNSGNYLDRFKSTP